jgi:hypothetical protein
MAGRPKIGSEVDLANKRKKQEIQLNLRKEQAAASSHFTRGMIFLSHFMSLEPIFIVIMSFILTVKRPLSAGSKADTDVASSSTTAQELMDISSIAAEKLINNNANLENPQCESSFLSSSSSLAAAANGAPVTQFEPTSEISSAETKTTAKVKVMCGLSKVLSAQQLKDADIAIKRMKESSTWPFPGSWYYPPSGPKLSEMNARDPNKYFSIPVLLFMPVCEFSNRFVKCPCARFGYSHKRVISNGYTEPCRVVGTQYTYAMVGNRYLCHDCKEITKDSDASSYTFNSYDERVSSYLPPDIR